MTINHIYIYIYNNDYVYIHVYNHASCILIVCLFFHARKSLQECEHAQMHALLGAPDREGGAWSAAARRYI